MKFNFEHSHSFAKQMDAADALSAFRTCFHIPQHKGADSIYFCGNSLGLQPRKAAEYVNQELSDWARLGVEGHFKPGTGWFAYHELLRESTARLVGAQHHEVVVMNHLTVNLHLLLVSFYRPTAERYKIICEGGAFPSDRYALQSQVEWHGFDASDALVELQPREGEDVVRHEDIIEAIEDCGDSLALVMLGGVHYFTGQVLDLAAITRAAHEVEAYAGFDLAHAAGNLKLNLHNWGVDFAAWCSYKYINGGPGTVAGAFIHDRHVKNLHLPRFAGWWGNDPQTRFTMPHRFIPVPSADSWQLSNAPVLEMAALRASMELFDDAGMDALTEKSRQLTSYLLFTVREVMKQRGMEGVLEVITPFEEQQQGCQLSLSFKGRGRELFDALTRDGVVADWREPDQEGREEGVIRVAPVPLYNSYEDVWRFGQVLDKALQAS
jgi:kynureninase